ncbi:MAG: MinD/ParA family protein [Deferribacteraceae bacterium]|jgi:flagellar biosynthesis protein FlhG|nr:MinD/ParA family protein [Deferribacteraceae bacterium]
MERQLNDQAASLRKIAWERGRHAKYISVSSGKGGVGKTTFVVNLAYALSQAGKRVLVFDADLSLGNIDIMLKIPAGINIRQYLAGKAKLEDVLVHGIYGFDVLPASSGFVELADLSEQDFAKIQQVFVTLDNNYDYIIFDTGAGISDSVHKFVSMAEIVIAVTQPEPPAIADAYAFFKTAKQLHSIEKAYIVFNRVDNDAHARKVFENLAGVAKKFLNLKIELLANMPEDPEVKRTTKTQKLLSLVSPQSPFAKGISVLANRINSL